ncbi:MAG: hypothetical protein HYY03_01855 [Chloroflexi bacterium]|nr:hypothetical protein [Chloroflexota bacterium]
MRKTILPAMLFAGVLVACVVLSSAEHTQATTPTPTATLPAPLLFPDTDGDGFHDAMEYNLGSDPLNSASTPEHYVFPATCSDGLDNDLDGLVDAADPGTAGGCILHDKQIELWFHVLPEADLAAKQANGELPCCVPAKDAMEAYIDSLLEEVDEIWAPAHITFVKARLTFDVPKNPNKAKRSEAKKKANKDHPTYYHVFLTDTFADSTDLGLTTTFGQTANGQTGGTFIRQRAWIDDPNTANDDNDPTNGWKGEDPPGEVLAHELGHGLGAEPKGDGVDGSGHYTADNKRHKLMHGTNPCGITLNPREIENARKAALAEKFEGTLVDGSGDWFNYPTPALATVGDAFGDIRLAVASPGVGDIFGQLSAKVHVGPIPDPLPNGFQYNISLNVDMDENTGTPAPTLVHGEDYLARLAMTPSGMQATLIMSGFGPVGGFEFDIFRDEGTIVFRIPLSAVQANDLDVIKWRAWTLSPAGTADMVPVDDWAPLYIRVVDASAPDVEKRGQFIDEDGDGIFENPAVGGTTDLVVDSAGASQDPAAGATAASFPLAAIASALAAAAVAAAAGGWYARRRWSRIRGR